MSVRKRILPSGKTSWLVAYRDLAGDRRFKGCASKSDALSFELHIRSELAAGIHVADRASATVKEATELWLIRAERENLEAGTVRQYRQHSKYYILPLLGKVRLSQLTIPLVEKFRDDLIARCPSRSLARAVLTSSKGVFKEARRLGLMGHDPAVTTAIKFSKDEDRKPEIPTKDQIRAIIAGSAMWPYTKVERGRSGKETLVAISWRPLIVTALLTGMRCSELRGLTWNRIDFDERVIRVRQRADFRNVIGSTKSRAGDRDIPIGPMVLNVLRDWRKACPNWPKNLVFPTEKGAIHSNGNIHRTCWGPLLKKLGITKQTGPDAQGALILKPALTFHSLRHAAASLFIDQGWNPKKVQVVLGHSSIAVTFDLYGHLFKDVQSDHEEMAMIEARLLTDNTEATWIA